jgi:hypothetical protein
MNIVGPDSLIGCHNGRKDARQVDVRILEHGAVQAGSELPRGIAIASHIGSTDGGSQGLAFILPVRGDQVGIGDICKGTCHLGSPYQRQYQ